MAESRIQQRQHRQPTGLRRGDRRRQPRGLRDGDPARPRRGPRRPGREAARPRRLQAHLLALHPGLGGADARTPRPARADHGGGRGALADAGLDAVGLDRGSARARPAYAVNLRRELLDPMVREAAASTPGVELMLGQGAHGLLRDGEAVRGVVVRDRDGEETRAAGQARRRRRRPRLADRRAGRRQRKGPPPRPLRLRRLLRGPAARHADPPARSGCSTRTGRRPSPPTAASSSTRRCRPRTACPSSSAIPRRRWSPSSPTVPEAPPIRDGAPGRRRARQDRDAEPGAGPDRPGPGPRRRRGAGGRPALRRRLRLGAAVGRMAGRQRDAGAARRRAAAERPRPLPPAPPQANCAGTPSSINDYATGRPISRVEKTALRRRGARPEDRDDLRRVRHAPGQARADDGDDAAAGDRRQRPARNAPRSRRRRPAACAGAAPSTLLAV